MPLTLTWWTDLKAKAENKLDAKTAPETDFEKELRRYDAARKDHADSQAALARAGKFLDQVQAARAASTRELTRQGFVKLAAHCNPNTRVLNTLISDDKKMLAAAKAQVDAMEKITKLGAPVLNLNTGPGGNTVRQGKFDDLKQAIEELHDELKGKPQLTKDDIDRCLTHMDGIAKNAKLYCGDRPELRTYNDDVAGTVAGFKTVKTKWGDKKVTTNELLLINTRLTRMRNAQFVK